MAERRLILLIDDDSDIRGFVHARLVDDGFEVLMAENGEAGLRAAADRKPDLILLDWMMPGMDGFMVLEALKNDDNTAMIPVIMLTSKGQMDDVEMALAAGAANYLTKPIDLSKLSRQATKELEKR